MSNKISKHFSWAEYEHSNYATRNDIDNSVPEELKGNVIELAEKCLEPIRMKFGPTKISSGYRCPELNRAIGGSKNSQHTKAEAADLQFRSSVDLEEVFEWIKDNVDFDQVIYEFGAWIHISRKKEGNRGRSLIAYRDNGKTRYKAG